MRIRIVVDEISSSSPRTADDGEQIFPPSLPCTRTITLRISLRCAISRVCAVGGGVLEEGDEGEGCCY